MNEATSLEINVNLDEICESETEILYTIQKYEEKWVSNSKKYCQTYRNLCDYSSMYIFNKDSDISFGL